MDLEVKTYIDKLNEELPRLLLWRREILEQIDIDRNLPGFQITEKYHQITTSLNKTIDDLKVEIRELKKGHDNFNELDVFGKRLAEELRKMLSWRREITVETSIEQKKLTVAADARLEILADLNNQLINSRLSLEEIKAAKEDFVAALSAKEKTLELKDKELVGKEKLLTAKNSELVSKEKQVSKDIQDLAKEKRAIVLDKNVLENSRQFIERQITEINAERITGQKLNQAALSKLKKWNERLIELNGKEKVLLFREEALDRRGIELDKKRSRIKDIELKEKLFPIKEKELSAKEISLIAKENLLVKEAERVAEEKQKTLDKMIETGKMLVEISQEREGMKNEVIKASAIIREAKDKQSEIYRQSQTIIGRYNRLLNDEKILLLKAGEIEKKSAELDEKSQQIENKRVKIMNEQLLKENELAGREKELTGRDGELNKKEKAITELTDNLAKEKTFIDWSKKSLDLDRQEIERQILKVNSERVAGQELNRVKQAKLKKLDEKLSALDKKDQTLLLKEEVLTKQTDTISEQFNQLDKEKKQLTNQQSSLRRAIFLARLRGIKI